MLLVTIDSFLYIIWSELKFRYSPVKVGFRYTDDVNPCFVRVIDTYKKDNFCLVRSP